jgi:predicted peptidase
MRTLLLSLFFVAVQSVQAQPPEAVERFQAHSFSSPSGLTLGYRALVPADIEEGKTYPLIVFLHGAGERGDDNTIQLVHGMADLCTDEMMARHPAFVIAPQCPNEQRWSNVDWSSPSSTLPEEVSDSLSATIELVDAMCEEFPIDKDRLYITGLSMGGYGTWDALARYPGKFAAAIPICGGGDPAQVEHIGDTPIWVFHGDQDEAVRVGRSREMVNALREAGHSPIYTEYEGVGHDSWTETYHNRLVWDWLFAQRLAGE